MKFSESWEYQKWTKGQEKEIGKRFPFTNAMKKGHMINFKRVRRNIWNSFYFPYVMRFNRLIMYSFGEG